MIHKLVLFIFNSFPLLVLHTSIVPRQPCPATSPTHRERINAENREIRKLKENKKCLDLCASVTIYDYDVITKSGLGGHRDHFWSDLNYICCHASLASKCLLQLNQTRQKKNVSSKVADINVNLHNSMAELILLYAYWTAQILWVNLSVYGLWAAQECPLAGSNPSSLRPFLGSVGQVW